MSTAHPVPTNLEFIKKQSKDLRKAFAEGHAEALRRIHDHLPRARQLSAEQMLTFDLSLQECQHALACEYGFGKWEELLSAVKAPQFEDLVRLPDQAIEVLMRHTDQKDLVIALVGASDTLQERLLVPLSDRVRWFIRTEKDFVGIPPAERVEDARRRILAQYRELRDRGKIWSPASSAQAPVAETARAPKDPRMRVGVPLMDLTPAELLWILVAADEEARREGILMLARYMVKGRPETLLSEAFQLAIDGTEPALLEDLLETQAATILRNRTLRAYLALEGWLSIHSGDNPMFVQQKMESLFVETPELVWGTVAHPTVDELIQSLRATPASAMTLSQMVIFYRDLAFLRRQQGLPAVLPLVDAIDDPVLVAGIRATIVEGLDHGKVVEVMEARAQHERLALCRRHRMVIHGILGIQAGDNPAYLEGQVRDAGEKGVAEMSAKGFPSYV